MTAQPCTCGHVERLHHATPSGHFACGHTRWDRVQDEERSCLCEHYTALVAPARGASAVSTFPTVTSDARGGFLFRLTVPIYSTTDGVKPRFVCCKHNVEEGHAPRCTPEMRIGAIEAALTRAAMVHERSLQEDAIALLRRLERNIDTRVHMPESLMELVEELLAKAQGKEKYDPASWPIPGQPDYDRALPVTRATSPT